MSGRKFAQWMLVLMIVAMVFSGCSPSPTPTPTAEPTAVAPGSGETGEAAPSQLVTVPEVGLRFEVPGDWARMESEWRWLPPVPGVEVGLVWAEIEPPIEPEAAMLPSPSQILDSTEVMLDWTSGRSFTVEVYAPAEGGDVQAQVQTVEQHVLLTAPTDTGRRVYDFYAVAPDLEALETVSPQLLQVVASTRLQEQGAAGWRDKVIQAVAAELSVAPGAVTVVSEEAVQWPNACLGVEAEGQMCAQVITPGYRVTVEVAGQSYEVHTDESGDTVLFANGS